MNLNTHKLLRNLSKFLLIIIGVGLVGYLGYLTYGSLNSIPRKVRITNLTESSATVSWITDTPTKGVVYYKETDSLLPGPLAPFESKKAYDDRDYYSAQLENINSVNEKNLGNKEADDVVDTDKIEYEDFRVTKLGDYYTHHVTIRGLNPLSTYYFVVSDNWFSWKFGNVDQERELTEIPTVFEFNFTTFDRLNSVPAPNPAYGKVVGVYKDENGFVHDNLNQDTIVYGFLFKEEDLEQTGVYSSVTNEDGGWVLDKASMRSEEGLLPYNFKEGEDLLVLYPQYMNLEEAFSVGLILGEEDTPAPDLVGGQELNGVVEENNLLNRLNNVLSTGIFAGEVVDDFGGGTLLVLRSGIDRNKEKESLSVVGVSSAATSIRDTIDKVKVKNPEASTGDLIKFSAAAAKKRKEGTKKLTEEEIEELIAEVVPEEELLEEIGDIRNTTVKCSDLLSTIYGDTKDRSGDNWSYNCTKDGHQLTTCSGNTVSAGCGTQSACYQGSGRGDDNKCTGCSRPASCANVWSRPEDVVVNGKLYAKSDFLKVFLGNIDGSNYLGELSASLNGKTICTNQAGDKIMGVVNNSSSCPQYSYPTLSLGNSSEGSLILGNTTTCKDFLTGFDKGLDVDKYCKGAIVSDSPPYTPPACPIGSLSCNEKNKYNCEELDCGNLKKYLRKGNNNGCFCEDYGRDTVWQEFSENIELDSGNVVKRNAFTIAINDVFLRRDVIYLERALMDVNAVVENKVTKDGITTFTVYMTDEEHRVFLEKGQGIGGVITSFVKEGLGGIISKEGYKYYDDKSKLEYEIITNKDGKYLVEENYLRELSAKSGIKYEDLVLQISSGLYQGTVLAVEGSENLFVVESGRNVLEALDTINDGASELMNENTYKHPSYPSIQYKAQEVIYPATAKDVELKYFDYCIGGDPELCQTFLAESKEAVYTMLDVEEEMKPLVIVNEQSGGKSIKIKNCPTTRDCGAIYTTEIMEGGKKVSKTYRLPYKNHAPSLIVLKTQTGDIILKLDSANVSLGEASISDTGLGAYEEQINEQIQSSLFYFKDKDTANNGILSKLILGIFSPTKVQAQQSDPYASSEQGLYEIITASGKKVYYVDTTNQSYIIFYEEGNNEPGFQEPADINNPQTGEDVLVFVNKDSIKKISQAYNYWIEEGINMMSFPFIPINSDKKAMMASELMIANNGVATKISQITYFENGKWNGGIKASGDNKYVGFDFPLVPGRGYLIVGEYGTNVSIPGFALDKPFPVELSAGWNFVGIHGYNEIYTAEKLIDSIDQLEGVDVDNVTWWPRNLGRYESIQKSEGTLYGFDYPLSDRLGYFVRVASYSNKCPRSVLWNPGGDSDGICGSN